MTRKANEPEIEYTDEQKADIEERLVAAREERDHVNACDRRYRIMMLQIYQEAAQNIDGLPISDKFEVAAWQTEWNGFRVQHGLPELDFELLKERALAKKSTQR
jgi:hypothetical protein